MKKRKHKPYTNKKMHKLLTSLIKKHKQVTVVSEEYSFMGECFTGNYRKRRLTKNGESFVAYKGRSYDKWSGFTPSCFSPYTVDKRHNASGIVRTLLQHDSDGIIIREIRAGKRRIKI